MYTESKGEISVVRDGERKENNTWYAILFKQKRDNSMKPTFPARVTRLVTTMERDVTHKLKSASLGGRVGSSGANCKLTSLS